MSDENTAYYIAKGGSLAAIIDYIERRKAAQKQHKAFADKFGATSWTIGHSSFGDISVIGLNFDASAPEGWKQTKVRGSIQAYLVPTSRKIKKEMESLRIYGPGKEAGSAHFTGASMFTPGFELLGTDYVIKQHEKATPPPDAIPLKRSEYWAMKEAEAK
jgi:hypothetical protein